MIVATSVLVKLRLPYHGISPERCVMTYLWVNLIFNYIVYLMVYTLGSILNT